MNIRILNRDDIIGLPDREYVRREDYEKEVSALIASRHESDVMHTASDAEQSRKIMLLELTVAELKEKLSEKTEVSASKFGCHCELEPNQEPDECVIDQGRRDDCVHAGHISCKEKCSYWRKIERV